jgi:hypothetical protein
MERLGTQTPYSSNDEETKETPILEEDSQAKYEAESQLHRVGPHTKNSISKYTAWALRRRGCTREGAKEIFRIFEWHKQWEDMDPDVLERVQELFNFKGVYFDTHALKGSLLARKADKKLDSVMLNLGWSWPLKKFVDGKKCRSYSPADMKHIRQRRNMPPWLPWDYIVLDPKDNIEERLSQMELLKKAAESDSNKIGSAEDSINLG